MLSIAPLTAVILAVAFSTLSGNAVALTCFMVFDRSDNVIYRDVYPPVDLSETGRAERDTMRRRGEFLLFMESEQCPRLEYFTGSAGTVALRLDETLSPRTADAARERAKPAPQAPRNARRARPAS